MLETPVMCETVRCASKVLGDQNWVPVLEGVVYISCHIASDCCHRYPKLRRNVALYEYVACPTDCPVLSMIH